MIRRLITLASIVAVLALSAFVVPSPAGATAPSGDASQLYNFTNDARSSNGRPWLAWDQNLANTAQDHANWMAATGNFSHDSSLQAHVGAVVPALTAWGENIAYVTTTSNDIWQMMYGPIGYMNSEGHRNNLLGAQYDRMGIGIAHGGGLTYSVVRFATSSNKSALGQSVGSFDTASSPGVNKIRVGGWGIDPDSLGSVQVDVKVNGALTYTMTAGASRTDIGGAYEGFGNNHGFDATISTIGGSTKSVCVEIRNLAGFGGTVPLGCKNVAVVPDLSGPFYDVSSTHPFETEIAWLESQGITSGFSDGTFRPNDTVTREAIAAFLWRYAGEPSPAPNAPNFTDVPANHPFRTAIRWLAGEGIASGYSDGTFRGGKTVTRQAVSSFLWKLAGSPTPPPDAPTFTDVPAGHQFRTPIMWMGGVEITSGYSNGTFHPVELLSRQAMAAFLYRYDGL